MRSSLARSDSSILRTGMPVHLLTTAAMSSSVTSSLRKEPPSPWSASMLFCASSTAFSAAGISPYCSRLAAS